LLCIRHCSIRVSAMYSNFSYTKFLKVNSVLDTAYFQSIQTLRSGVI
jgi:hypothetical protein